METKLNIAGILKEKPVNTRLYSPIFGNCILVFPEGMIIKDKSGKICYFYDDGRFSRTGESLLFASKEMRDWSKFAWKKGDVLVSNDSTTKVIFNGWKDDTYTLFRGAYAVITHNDGKIEFGSDSLIFETCNYKGIEVEDAAQSYINYIERRLGGKLNLETLEIEKTQPEFKDGDILCVIDNSNDYHYILIYKGQDDKHIHRYVTMFEDNSLNIKKDSYLTKPEDYSTHYATDEEKQQLFAALEKENKAWDADKKQIVALEPEWTPKPFDRVITRTPDTPWTANFFSHIDSDGVKNCIDDRYIMCLPYNEETAKLIGTTNNAK